MTSTPSVRPLLRHAMKSTLMLGPPRLRFKPTSRPLHLACSMILLRRNLAFSSRRDKLMFATRYCGYRDSMQSAMSDPSLLLHDEGLLGLGLGSGDDPPPDPPPGSAGGAATGSAGVLNVIVDDQLLISDSDTWRARTRQ